MAAGMGGLITVVQMPSLWQRRVRTGVEMNEPGDTLPAPPDPNDGTPWKWLVGCTLLRRRGERHPSPLQILKGCIGLEISRIGDLDVDL
jgi:hypothetical protein